MLISLNGFKIALFLDPLSQDLVSSHACAVKRNRNKLYKEEKLSRWGSDEFCWRDAFWKPHYVLSHHPVYFLMLHQVPAVLLSFSIICCIALQCSHLKSCKILIIAVMLCALCSVKNKAQLLSPNTLK